MALLYTFLLLSLSLFSPSLAAPRVTPGTPNADMKAVCQQNGYTAANWVKYGAGKTLYDMATGIDSQKVGPNAPTTWPTTLQDYIAKRAKNVNNFHCTGLTECTFGNSVEDCEQSPFEYVMLNGITNLGHWIFNIIDAAGRAFPTTGFSSAQMLGTFTNKSPSPAKIQSGLGIANGILGAISVAYPIAGIPAGVGGIISGAVGLAMADIKQPFDQWADVTKYLTQINLAFNSTLTDYANWLLSTVPGKGLDGKDIENAKNYHYAEDSAGLIKILGEGAFQERKDVAILPKNLYSSFTAPVVNFLWKLPEQQAFIFKANKDQYNGQDVCNGNGNPTLDLKDHSGVAVMTKSTVWCDGPHGTAHIVGQWKWEGNQRSLLSEGWYNKVGTVPGADKLGDDVNGYLDIKTVILSSIIAQEANGGIPSKDLSAQQVADQITATQDLSAVPIEKTQSWSLPVCDLTGIKGDKTCNGSVFRGPMVSIDSQASSGLMSSVNNEVNDEVVDKIDDKIDGKTTAK